MKKIYTVTVDGIQHPYPEGTPYQDIAGELQPAYSNEILLVERDGRLCELGKQLDRDCTLKMITIQDKPGMQTYERSAIFLMLKAFYDIVGSEHIERICVEYSLSHALFITAQGSFRLDQPLLEQVESRMKELYRRRFPFKSIPFPPMTPLQCLKGGGSTIKQSCSAAGSVPRSIITLWRTSPTTFTGIWSPIPNT